MRQQKRVRRRRPSRIAWTRTDEEDPLLRTVDLEALMEGLEGPVERWNLAARQPIRAKPERYFFHLARVTMMLIEVELHQLTLEGARVSSPQAVTQLRDAWDAFALTETLGADIRQAAWMIRSRLFLLADYGEWLGNRVTARLPPESADVLVDAPPAPIMQWTLSACVDAMASLLSGWREACLTAALVSYVRLLRARCVAFSAYAFRDTSRLNRPDMVKDGHVTLTFFTECDLTFTPLEREMRAVRNLVDGASEVHPQPPFSDDDAWSAVLPWAKEVVASPRVHAITDRFRAGLIEQLLHPGETDAFRVKWPEADANPRNVINRLRRESFDRYSKHFMSPALADLLAKPIRYDGLVPGLSLVRNYAIRVIAHFILEENEQGNLLRVVDPDDVVAGRWPRAQLCILRLAGSYYLWTGEESRELFHCGRRFFVAMAMWLEKCEEAERLIPVICRDDDSDVDMGIVHEAGPSWWRDGRSEEGPSLELPQDC